MKTLTVALVAVVLGSGAALAADEKKAGKKQDMSKLTCGEFVQMGSPDAIMTLFWIDGYRTKKDEATVWDADTFVEHRNKLVTICTAEDGKDKLVLEEVQNLG